jgi:hypothetical protein
MFALAAAALFIVAAFAADGHALAGWPALTWLCLGLAAWVLETVVPIALPRRRTPS